jgi:hypothetical protein
MCTIHRRINKTASTFPTMPRDALGTAQINGAGSGVTFGSGTPYNGLEYTIFDTDYMEGETNGFDTFFPVDPSEDFPGADRVKYLRGVNNLDLDFSYNGVKGDRIILGTADFEHPFCLKGNDGLDNDFISIQNFDYNHGHIQLQGKKEDYQLIYCTEDDSCKTNGYYLFYTKAYRVSR